MVRLLINVDNVATLRQQRGTVYPDPVLAAGLCELAGADGITVHLREDRRHVQERDLRLLRQTVRGGLNLAMAAVPSLVDLALQVGPDLCTLVPETRDERTTERGVDLRAPGNLATLIRTLRDGGMRVSVCIDPDEDAARAAADLGATQAELHTGDYARATAGTPEASRLLARLEKVARVAVDSGLRLAAGHGLDYANVGPVARLPNIDEMSVGHSVIARAVLLGMERAVQDMRKAIDDGIRLASG